MDSVRLRWISNGLLIVVSACSFSKQRPFPPCWIKGLPQRILESLQDNATLFREFGSGGNEVPQDVNELREAIRNKLRNDEFLRRILEDDPNEVRNLYRTCSSFTIHFTLVSPTAFNNLSMQRQNALDVLHRRAHKSPQSPHYVWLLHPALIMPP